VLNWVVARRQSLALGVAVVLPLGVAAVMVPFRASFADAAAALVLVAVVALVAIVGTRVGGYVATVSAALCFDFFLTRPYDQFAMTQRPDIEIAVTLVVVGAVVTELAARSRHHHRVAGDESDYVKLIHEVSELSTSGASRDEVVSRVSAELVRLLHLRDCTFEAGPTFKPMTTINGDGSVHLGPLVWPVERWGLPGSQIGLEVHGRGRMVGRFVLTPTSAEPVSLERRVVAVALADQVSSLVVPYLRAV